MLVPSKPRVVEDGQFKGVYEIDGLYPGYGYTLGNSLRRIILSSLPGAAITSVKIAGVDHEFSTISGVKEDVINIILNLKKVRIKLLTDEPQEIRLKVKGVKDVTAKDIEIPGQAEILNPDQHIASVTDKNTTLEISMIVVKGLGYIPKEELQKDKVEIGSIALDAYFTPIRRVSYEVENMRVGDRTDFNRLRIFIETDGMITAKEALENSIDIMIRQLKAIVGFKEEEVVEEKQEDSSEDKEDSKDSEDTEFLKTRVETLDLSARTMNALDSANIRTVGGLARKKEEDLLAIDGLGGKGLQEIKRALSNFGITLKS
ncbi:DNA-directed RNA polymerase subunit alpha [Candidatus Campbellbacteria bacterium RIFCSPLOWO2_01_FULL_34_15]|uniref:DNA-directed RNA polymerase subunit alpha n=2 Tax=Candidatus Campbelliibacteriota TaxID=1752727 RepID=A0A1F5EMH3_9BACT|nr:MAG: DNA-directed RNA polymerase subunit alpha [Candidatus Campbellbacteria bacterium RIFCSPHIGHO2_01_FULL_34_10]OGD68573.1 MAG: DNA-directed RNA polymerase subunit alpha [Candidatus Campbellbacteria bacterium RIFCSPLOWO2_01_FULL_34_15]